MGEEIKVWSKWSSAGDAAGMKEHHDHRDPISHLSNIYMNNHVVSRYSVDVFEALAWIFKYTSEIIDNISFYQAQDFQKKTIDKTTSKLTLVS